MVEARAEAFANLAQARKIHDPAFGGERLGAQGERHDKGVAVNARVWMVSFAFYGFSEVMRRLESEFITLFVHGAQAFNRTPSLNQLISQPTERASG